MTNQRGSLRPRQGLMERSNTNKQSSTSVVANNKNQEVVLASSSQAEDRAYVQRIRQKARELRALASPNRSQHKSSDSVSLETEGTGISTLTGSSGGRDQQHHRKVHNHQSSINHHPHPRSRIMSPPQYTIFEDELQSRATQSSYISRPIDVDSMQEYDEEEELQSRTTNSSCISRPIDVDTMEEYEEELKPPRADLDDARSRSTASTYSSRPIDVDSVLEYDPEEHSEETRLPDDRFEKIMNFNNGYYEGESLLEYSSDEDSIDFETGLTADTRKDCEGPEKVSSLGLATGPAAQSSHKVRDESALKVASLKKLDTTPTSPDPHPLSVDLLGPIHIDTCYLLTVNEDECVEDLSFREWEFPILDEREFERELVGYMEGFEPFVEDLEPQMHLRRTQSDATSTRSSNTRVTFEI